MRRHVRKAAVLSLSTLAHHKPRLLAGQLPPLLPKLYAQTAVDESLIRVVDLGPFKHRIDDGLELRKVGRGPTDAPLCCCQHLARLLLGPRVLLRCIGGESCAGWLLCLLKSQASAACPAGETRCLCRQAAFEAMDVLLDNARDQLDFPTFVSHLEAGLSVRARRPCVTPVLS